MRESYLIRHQIPRQGSAPRWYATEPTEEKKVAGEAELPGQAPTETSEAGDPIRKELEAKGKEIIELKVRFM